MEGAPCYATSEPRRLHRTTTSTNVAAAAAPGVLSAMTGNLATLGGSSTASTSPRSVAWCRAHETASAPRPSPTSMTTTSGLAQACAASVRTEGTEKHGPDEVPDELLGQVLLPTRRKARIDGFDLDTELCVKEHERDRLNARRALPAASAARLGPAEAPRSRFSLRRPLHADVKAVELGGRRMGWVRLADPMLGRGDDPFPFEAVRDLLGVVRATYGAEKAAGAGRVPLARIEKIGNALKAALDLAVESSPGTVGHRPSWARAEDATRRVGDLVDRLTPAEPIVAAARARVSGTRVALRKKAPER